jgi:heterodisulfide reductase subunit B
MLLRPHEEIGLDDPEKPRILDDLLRILGCEVVDFAYKTKCCGSYLGTSQPDVVDDCVNRILASAKERGAEAVATPCALCHFNLDRRGNQLPVFCISQLLAIGLGAGHEVCRFDLHRVNPVPALKNKGII